MGQCRFTCLGGSQLGVRCMSWRKQLRAEEDAARC